MTSHRNFWSSLAALCSELAPVVGPLVSVVGETASAVDRASADQRKLIFTTEERAALPAARKRKSTKSTKKSPTKVLA